MRTADRVARHLVSKYEPCYDNRCARASPFLSSRGTDCTVLATHHYTFRLVSSLLVQSTSFASFFFFFFLFPPFRQPVSQNGISLWTSTILHARVLNEENARWRLIHIRVARYVTTFIAYYLALERTAIFIPSSWFYFNEFKCESISDSALTKKFH